MMLLIEDAKREEAESPMSRKEILAETRRLARAGQRRASELGINTSDAAIVKMIQEMRVNSEA